MTLYVYRLALARDALVCNSRDYWLVFKLSLVELTPVLRRTPLPYCRTQYTCMYERANQPTFFSNRGSALAEDHPTDAYL